MSLRELAQRVGVSYEAIRKYEQGQLTPNSEMLLKLARALGKPVDYFRAPAVRVGSIQPMFRGHARRAKRDEAALEAHIRDWLERYLTVEQIVDKVARFEYPEGFPRQVHSPEEVEQAATDLRRAWELGLAPIANLTETLEERGIRVGEVPAYDGFEARAYYMQNDEPTPVIVCSDKLLGLRRRLSMAREVGRIMLRPSAESGRKVPVNRFARAFLVPKPAEELQQLSFRYLHPNFPFSPLLPSLTYLERYYGLSAQVLLQRLHDLNLISRTQTAKLKWGFRMGVLRESSEHVWLERPTRFRRLVLEAYASELITASRASQLLGVPLQEFLREYTQLQGGEPAGALCGG